MYALKVLSGQNVGEVYTLYDHETIIGRSAQCNIQIPNDNISKQHAKIIIDPQKAILADLNSTNGSFVNGIKVEISIIKPGDKISLYDTILEFHKEKSNKFSLGGSVVPHAQTEQKKFEGAETSKLAKLDQELEKKLLPPFYILMEKMDFRLLISLFAISFIFFTALLSTIPLMTIIKESVEVESKSRAKSLAKLLAISNQEALRTERLSSLNVDIGFKEPGVKKAVIIRQETGEVISPAIMSGSFLKGPVEGKVNTYRKLTDRPHHTFNAGGSTIISMYPIKFYSNTEGLEITKYYTVVVYNSRALAMSNSHTINLLVQTLFLSLLFGSILLYILLHIIDRPLKKLKEDLAYSGSGPESKALETNILNSAVQDIYISINSLLTKTKDGESSSGSTLEMDRSFETQNITEMIGYACVIISNGDETLLDYNPYFEELTNLYDLKGKRVVDISDNALQQNISDLIERVRLNPESIETNDFEFSGIPYIVKMQGVYGSTDVAYFVCAFMPHEESE